MMPTGKEKLSDDLRILEDMTGKLEQYLDSEHLFWQAHDDRGPEPTIGQYLLRLQRLQALNDSLLDAEQRRRLAAATQQINQVVANKRVSYIEKARQEFKTRLRLWREALQELLDDEFPSMAFYRTEVENRVILEALLEALKTHSAQVEPDLVEQLATLDRKLRQRWQPGSFIWPSEWQPVYPRSGYWWLHGELAEK
jgi:hypothetical protein